MANNKNLQKRKPFKKNDPRINREGRPKKLISNTLQELKEKGILEPSKNEVKSLYLRLLNVSIPELKKMEKDDEQSGLVRIVIKNILSGKGFDIIEKMLDRSIGKADENIKGKIETVKRLTTANLTDKELIQYKKLQEKCR